MVIEVVETSARFDRTVKGAAYAQAGIPEYWLIDLARGRVEVSSEPAVGSYQTVRAFRTGESLAIPVAPQVDLPVDAILESANGVLDESALTGESRPVERVHGEQIRSGAVNAGPAFDLRAEDGKWKVAGEYVRPDPEAPLQAVPGNFGLFFLVRR